jgi:hypothetical protein
MTPFARFTRKKGGSGFVFGKVENETTNSRTYASEAGNCVADLCVVREP